MDTSDKSHPHPLLRFIDLLPQLTRVVPGKLLAGYCPGAKDPKEATAKISALLNAGIRHVINIVEPDETDITGQPFVPYEELLEPLAAKRRVSVTFDRLPIKDMLVPPERFTWRIQNQIDLFIGQGRPVYVHCLGDIGRAGTVVECYLRRHGVADGKNVLEIIKDLRKDCEDAGRRSPETREQREMVVGLGNMGNRHLMAEIPSVKLQYCSSM